jgi:2-oxoglutarate ferredoxin oxidoreductase subunit gamma
MSGVKMNYDIIVAGFGGQGIMQLGRIMALCGMLEKREVTCIPAYGAEMRGGTANCTVVISSHEIGSPVVRHPQALIAMNQPSLDKFGPQVMPAGLILINTSLVGNESFPVPTGINLIGVAATQIAKQIGQQKAANMVALGAFIAHTKLFSLDTALTAVQQTFAELRPQLIELNIQALKHGAQKLQLL